MWNKIKTSFDSGIEKIKWFASLLSERLKIELSIIKLMQDCEKKEGERGQKMRLIGERVFELKNLAEKGILNDKTIVDSMAEIEKLDAEIDEIKKKTAEISKVEI